MPIAGESDGWPSRAGHEEVDARQIPSEDERERAAWRHYTMLRPAEPAGSRAFLGQTWPDNKTGADAGLTRWIFASWPDAWQTMGQLQQSGAGVGVAVNSFNERRNATALTRINSVWIEADGGINWDRLPIEPSLVIETSPGKCHAYFILQPDTTMTPSVFSGVMRRLVAEHGCDKSAADVARVLRLAGTWHQKDPTNRHLVLIDEARSTGVLYSVNDILEAFPPTEKLKPEPRPRTRTEGAVWNQGGRDTYNGSDAEITRFAIALHAIDQHQTTTGQPLEFGGNDPDDATYVADIREWSWWFRMVACVHQYARGEPWGFELAGVASKGGTFQCPNGVELSFAGAPHKFNASHQRETWDGFRDQSALQLAEQTDWVPLTGATIFYAAQFADGYTARGRPRSRLQVPAPDDSVQPVLEAARMVARHGVEGYVTAFRSASREAMRYTPASVRGQVIEHLLAHLDPTTGLGVIDGPRALVAAGICTSNGAARKQLQRLENDGWLVTSRGNAIAHNLRRGMSFAISIPQAYQAHLSIPGYHPAYPNTAPGSLCATGTSDAPFMCASGTQCPGLASPFILEGNGGRGGWWPLDAEAFLDECAYEAECLPSSLWGHIKTGKSSPARATDFRRIADMLFALVRVRPPYEVANAIQFRIPDQIAYLARRKTKVPDDDIDLTDVPASQWRSALVGMLDRISVKWGLPGISPRYQPDLSPSIRHPNGEVYTFLNVGDRETRDEVVEAERRAHAEAKDKRSEKKATADDAFPADRQGGGEVCEPGKGDPDIPF